MIWNSVSWTWQSCCTDELTEVVVAWRRPVQYQTNQHSRIDEWKVYNAPPLAESLQMPAAYSSWKRESQLSLVVWLLVSCPCTSGGLSPLVHIKSALIELSGLFFKKKNRGYEVGRRTQKWALGEVTGGVEWTYQWLGIYTALIEDPSLNPGTHVREFTTACNSSSGARYCAHAHTTTHLFFFSLPIILKIWMLILLHFTHQNQ